MYGSRVGGGHDLQIKRAKIEIEISHNTMNESRLFLNKINIKFLQERDEITSAAAKHHAKNLQTAMRYI